MNDNGFLWYRLVCAPGFGAKSVHYLLEHMLQQGLTLSDLFVQEEAELQRRFPAIGQGKLSRARFANLLDAGREEQLWAEYEALVDQGVALIGLDDPRYPPLVRQRLGDEAPPLLYAKGPLGLLQQPGLAIAGARDVAEAELAIARAVAQAAAASGFNVVSGYAKGVDTAAHLGALQADGTTTCVLSFGLNHLSLKDVLQEQRWERNALFVSQFAPWEKFSGANAMTRNRLICALSWALVVVKAGPEKDAEGRMSGTFNAGASALELGLPLWVLHPDRLASPVPGNAALIERGGQPFGSTEEVAQRLAALEPPSKPPQAPSAGEQMSLF
ncbi:MAG: DNA-processing protein DprA [Saprospiraceae bacterium]|nr:DNA-protecting protein DprA [Saprospiraceae bacterium]MDW8230149.1 DNA-processing protein DprA [Saprospiraceae bacterium]